MNENERKNPEQRFKKMIELYPHQKACYPKIVNTVRELSGCYLVGETRSGKTLTVLNAIDFLGFKKVLFVTKKNAISSIEDDFKLLNPSFDLTVINYESVHKVGVEFDFVVYDEAHGMGAFAKPSKRTKLIRERFYNLSCIWMSGTPAVESYSQYFHQFWVSKNSPFSDYKSFYKWAKDFVNVKKKRIGTHWVNDYTKAKVKEIDDKIRPYIVTLKKPSSDFAEVEENIIKLTMPTNLRELSNRMLKDRVIEGKDDWLIMGDLPAKLQCKVHQIENGHAIVERGIDETKTVIFDKSKAVFIREYFKGKKIAILFFYKAEREILKDIFKDEITESLNEFNTTEKNLMLYQGTTEGMNVSKSDCLVWYNFGFSGKDFIQAVDRLTIKGRESNENYFIMYENSLNEKIYKAVKNKETYNSNAFTLDYGIKKTK